MPHTYSHIISLGLNCEPSYALEDLFGRLDSYFLSWALVPDVPRLALALREPDRLFGDGYDIAGGSYDMFRCLRTGIQFHGKTNLRSRDYAPEAVRESFNELASRLDYLRRKFVKALQSGRPTLCILKNHHRGGSARGFTEAEALEIKNALDTLAAGGKADLLCVDRLGCEPQAFDPALEARGIYKRLLEGFAPGERAYFYDIPGWARIFAEFGAAHSPVEGNSFEERAALAARLCEAARAARLRDIQERMKLQEDLCR